MNDQSDIDKLTAVSSLQEHNCDNVEELRVHIDLGGATECATTTGMRMVTTKPKPTHRNFAFKNLLSRIAGATLLAVGFAFGPAQAGLAQSMSNVADICSDPLTSGPQKLPMLAAAGWVKQDESSIAAVHAIANAHIASFTTGLPDWPSRYAAVPQLAGNFITMINSGAISLWTKGEGFLAVSIQTSPEGTEHLACYYAGPENPETLEIIARYGAPQVFEDQGLTILRFDETAMVMNPEGRYKMYSTFSRHQSNPDFAHPDGYRLERVQEAGSE